MIIDFRYAGLVLNVFIAMIFGPGIPILFPIALINLSIMYVCDRLMTAYFYSQPPMFGLDMTDSALKRLQVAGTIYFATAYWMLSNKQIFGNNVYPIEFENESIKTGHYIKDIDPNKFDHTLPLLAVLALMLTIGIFMFFQSLAEEILGKSNHDHTQELLELENLPSFYETLYKSDIDQWIKEE